MVGEHQPHSTSPSDFASIGTGFPFLRLRVLIPARDLLDRQPFLFADASNMHADRLRGGVGLLTSGHLLALQSNPSGRKCRSRGS